MSENEIVTAGSLSEEEQQALLAEVTQPLKYVPRLDLMQAQSKAVDDGLAMPGEFVYNGDQNYGGEVVVQLLDFRAHAVMFDGSGNVIMESFDPSDDTFKTIRQKTAGPKIENERPGIGADFLFWNPSRRIFGIVPLLKSAARLIPTANTVMRRRVPSVLYSKKVEKSGNRWYVPLLRDFSGEVGAPPTPDEVTAAVQLFKQQEAQTGTDPNARPR